MHLKFPEIGLLRQFFCILRYLDYRRAKKNFKNIQNTVIDVKFNEELKSELRNKLPHKSKPENRIHLMKDEGKLAQKKN